MIIEHLGAGTGLSNEDVKMLVNKKFSEKSKMMKWSMKERNDVLKERVKSLKETLTSLNNATSKVTECAAKNEKSLNDIMNKMRNKIMKLEKEMKHNKKHLNQFEGNVSLLKDSLQEVKNENMLLSNKNKMSNEELISLKESLAESERQQTQAKVSLAVAEGRLEESLRQADGYVNLMLFDNTSIKLKSFF